MDVKIYNGDYDKSEFYSIMGKYFAEKPYKKELPYAENNANKKWYLFYDDHNFIGFLACEYKKHITLLSCVYVNPEFRNQGYCDKIIKYTIEALKDCVLQLTTNNPYLVKVSVKNKFEQVSEKGSYKVLRRTL